MFLYLCKKNNVLNFLKIKLIASISLYSAGYKKLIEFNKVSPTFVYLYYSLSPKTQNKEMCLAVCEYAYTCVIVYTCRCVQVGM